MYIKIVRLLVMFVACQIVVSGCYQKSDERTESNSIRFALLGNKCISPCWLGIELNTTVFDAAKSILQHHYGVENVTTNGFDLSWVATNEESSDGVSRGNVLFVDGVVVEILVAFDEKNNFEVQDLIEVLGLPKWVAASWGGPVQSNLPCMGVSLHFPDKGVIAVLNNKTDFKGVSQDQLVSLLRLVPVPVDNKWQVYDAVLVEWNGYQDYCQSVVESMPKH